MVYLEQDITLLTNEERASAAAKGIAAQFREMRVSDKIVTCPFWMNNDPVLENTPLYFAVPGGGKFTPTEILEKLQLFSSEKCFNVSEASSAEIWSFMRTNGLGVDCSGFVYQACKAVYESFGKGDFESRVVGCADNLHGIRKTRARDLTDPKNSIKIERVCDCKPGDIIRCKDGRHSIVVLEVGNDILTCAHSSDVVAAFGVSVFTIKLTNPDADIFSQEWSELHLSGLPFNEAVLKSNRSEDGVWRLKVLESVFNGH
jgi:hypothetical protein